MRIGVPKELYAGEKRVATTPDVAVLLIKMGYDVAVESSAGTAANYSDSSYEAAGCSVASRDNIWNDSDIRSYIRSEII